MKTKSTLSAYLNYSPLQFFNDCCISEIVCNAVSQCINPIVSLSLQEVTDVGAITTNQIIGIPATDPNGLVTLSQIENTLLDNVVVVGVLPTPDLLPNTVYTYNGEDDISYDLPPIIGNTGARIVIISMTTENITINSNAGGNDIYSSGTAINSLIVI